VKYIITIFLIVLCYSGFAQTSNKKRVLVIPPNRFEFVSEFDLEEIAEKNEITSSQVFLTYEKAILNAFSSYKDENYEFVPVQAAILKPYKKLIKYKYGKFKGKRFNAVDLQRFSEEEFTKLLEQHNSVFVIFITWYDIQKEAFSRKQSKRVPYAGHYLDFDIYNLYKQEIAAAGKVKAEADEPNDLQASYSLLRTKELESAYNNFVGKVVEQLSKPIEQ